MLIYRCRCVALISCCNRQTGTNDCTDRTASSCSHSQHPLVIWTTCRPGPAVWAFLRSVPPFPINNPFLLPKCDWIALTSSAKTPEQLFYLYRVTPQYSSLTAFHIMESWLIDGRTRELMTCNAVVPTYNTSRTKLRHIHSNRQSREG